MREVLSSYTSSKDNNFNIIRFIVATLVIFSHSFPIAHGPEEHDNLTFTFGISGGTIAVDIFFITSGFLITRSYFSRNNLIGFLWARIIRIYPALIAAILFCVFVVGLSFTNMNYYDYLTSNLTQKFFLKNIFLFNGVEYNLPGVFESTPLKNAVNGSLWTLPHEVRMYGILALLFSLIKILASIIGKSFPKLNFGFKYYKWALLLLGSFSIILHLVNHFIIIYDPNFVRLFSMFFIGATAYVWKEKIYLSSSSIFVIFSFLLFSAFNKDFFYIAYYLTLPYIILYLAYIPSGVIRNFNNYGDYSYGIYIYAFPIQQSLIQLIPNISVAQMSLLSFIVTFIFASISWHLIEKRSLRYKDSYAAIKKHTKTLNIK